MPSPLTSILPAMVCRRRGDKAAVAFRLDPHLIVGDEPWLQVLLRPKRKKAEREVRLAAA